MSQSKTPSHDDQGDDALGHREPRSRPQADEPSSPATQDRVVEAWVGSVEKTPESAAIEEITQLRDQLLRTQAEMENVRKRAQRDFDQQRKYANAELIRELLPAIDNLQRAVQSASSNGPSGEQADGLLQGVQMVLIQFEQTLQAQGCRRLGSVGEVFDPNFHEALGQEPSAEYDRGRITQVMQAGYAMHDRVVRPAQVFVSSGPA